MARTSTAAVMDRIDTSLSASLVDQFVDDANAWVTEFLTDCGASSDRLKKVELYLACHYVTLRDPRLRSQRADDIREDYQRDTQVTEYLRQAIAEDPCGIVKSKFLDQEETATVAFKAGVYDPD